MSAQRPRLALIYGVLKCEFSYRHISRTPNFRVKNIAAGCATYMQVNAVLHSVLELQFTTRLG